MIGNEGARTISVPRAKTLLFRRRGGLLSDRSKQVAVWNDPAVNRYDSVDIEPEAANVGLQIDRLWIGNLRRLGSRCERSIHIGFDEQLFFAQVGHDDAIVMWITDDLIKFYGARAIGQTVRTTRAMG